MTDCGCEYCSGSPPACCCCRRTGIKLRSSVWHSPYTVCMDCFMYWFDSGETDARKIGDAVRKITKPQI
jgi:hypothetical protein